MAVTPSSFRADFPEFANATTFPDSGITYWLNVATNLASSGAGLLNAQRWGTALDTGTELFIAHNLALEGRAQAEAAAGAIPGVTTGPVASKSVDKVSINYDVAAAVLPDAGHWNLTIYGTRFIGLARLMGMGPVTVVGAGAPPFSGPAWAGPPYWGC